MGLQNIQNQDMGLVLSTDAKPRLKWTPELHQRFVEAVNQLGGPESKWLTVIHYELNVVVVGILVLLVMLFIWKV